MPRRDGSPTRTELRTARRAGFFQDRLDEARTPVEALGAGFACLAAVIRKVEIVNPAKADQIAEDAVGYLLRQANAHMTTTAGGRR